MGVTYKPLLHTLVDKDLMLKDLRDVNGANLNSATVTRITRNEYVSLQTIEHLCRFLNCRIEDVVEIRGLDDERLSD